MTKAAVNSRYRYGVGVIAWLVVIGCDFDPLASGASGPAECDACHGSAENNDEPFGIDGTAGAHEAHLAGGKYGRPTACEECHRVPENVDDEDHVDALPAEVRFGSLAKADGADPEWNRKEGICSGVYCHGVTLSGGSNTTPEWMDDDVGCGSCHGYPPEDGHPDSTVCGNCHGEVYEGGGWVDQALHIDGTVQTGDL